MAVWLFLATPLLVVLFVGAGVVWFVSRSGKRPPRGFDVLPPKDDKGSR